MAKLTLVEAVRDGLAAEMRQDPRVIVLGEDVGVNGGVFRATDGLLAEFGPDRVIDTPLAESGIIGTAIGLAIGGMRPVAEIQFMDFIAPGHDQLVSHAARMRNRTRGALTVPLVIRTPSGGGIRPPEHHSDSTEAVYCHYPGIKVVIPSNPYDAKGLLIAAIRDDDPVLFMEPKRIYRAQRQEVPAEAYTVPLGKARVAREGNDCTLVSWGAMVDVCLEAAEQAEREHRWQAEVLDLRTLNPMDIDAVIASAEKTGRVAVVHEAPRQCGLGAEIAALIQERVFLYLQAPVVRVTGYDVPFPLASLEDVYLPNVRRVMAGIQKVMQF
ncbi:alpha-ketoacid dehydrogenase subunit beta [Caldinitratiruptor microaerophilus]|uniref:2-oxoisovalerate dehydrogenase subunit beta n=1 Tax=Caldinitratiruptor microaerophilus TaxID=671077 RepID=A0AA35CHM1_9FIRM|nr:alpha-ketoacid dehydrogenase subunit beta [Caldinitratiruptor microaerophilus]BDG59047.1 2-oxoisovalerate dehydrogenase subunit beta [Caldinitratiruptor microaerophilus]